MYPNCKENAFTLFEMMITLSIIAILATIALPHFHDFREKQEVIGLLPLVRQNVNMARNNAVTFHSDMVLCASKNMSNCSKDQWNQGLIIFSDLNNNAQVDGSEKIYSKIETNVNYGSFKWRGGFSHPDSLKFQGDTGLPRDSPGGFHYCSFKHPENNRYIPVSPMGHVRITPTPKC